MRTIPEGCTDVVVLLYRTIVVEKSRLRAWHDVKVISRSSVLKVVNDGSEDSGKNFQIRQPVLNVRKSKKKKKRPNRQYNEFLFINTQEGGRVESIYIYCRICIFIPSVLCDRACNAPFEWRRLRGNCCGKGCDACNIRLPSGWETIRACS